MAQPPFPQLVNFTSALRKSLLIPGMLFSPNDNISWIWSAPLSGSGGSPVALTGTIDGTNRVFTVPITISNGCAIYRNGVLQSTPGSYSLSAQTVTFVSAPVVGDDLEAIVS